jgi:hypothetical protein
MHKYKAALRRAMCIGFFDSLRDRWWDLTDSIDCIDLETVQCVISAAEQRGRVRNLSMTME